MVAAYRREHIIALAKEGSELSIDEIAKHFGVSRETVRRDLSHLEARGLIRRVHGGALPTQTGFEAGFDERLISNAKAKQRIAKLAASLFRENDTLMIDTGTTTSMLAAELAGAPRMTIITNSFGVANRVAAGSSHHRVHVIGGEYRSESQQMIGSVCLEQISRYRADHAVISCGAIDNPGGIMDFDFEEAMVARAMIEQSRCLTMIVDRSKFERVAMAKVCDLAAVDRLITDGTPSDYIAEKIKSNGGEIFVTGPVESEAR